MAGSLVEEIKARIDLVDLVGSSVALQRAGRSFRALCPFHAEKTPSFYVFPETQTWKCFGCGAGGDAFSFVMQRDQLEFGEALRLLAARAGVPLEPPDPARQEAHERLRRINEAAALYYHALLAQQPIGEVARRYLLGRGVQPETWERFTLGYAPDGGTALCDHLLGAGFTAEDLVAAGLATTREDAAPGPEALRDRFRHRLMFPIRDAQGRTIGFGGRTLTPDGLPKYLNTPQTALFEKGAVLYALDLARDAIRAERRAVIVEGYLDAVQAHQAGFRNVVAALGTAISERQLAPLGRLAEEIVFALDPDAAGDSATLRSLVVAREALTTTVPVPTARGIRYQATARCTLRVAQLPAGQDPDELIRQDPARWRALVASAPPVLEFLLARLPERHDLASPQGKSAAVEEVLPALRDLADPIERAHYVQRLAAVVGVPEQAIAELSRPAARRAAAGPVATARPDRWEEYALALVALGTPSGALTEADLARPDCRALLRWLRATGATYRTPDAAVPPELAPTWAAVVALAEASAAQPPERLRAELDNTVLELRKRRLAREEWEIASLIRDSAGEAPRELAQRLAGLAAQRAELERAQAAHGRVVASAWRFQVVKEGPHE
ncbi:MAG TPA: DNA primase [Chloroflexota bacterium]|nr:DNA primase [Chloroflexota bacterium]